jgi:thiamine-monophosphate kinase
VDQFLTGLLKLAARYSVPLAGGDTAQSPEGVLADIVLLGSVPAGKAVMRSGARAGDLLYVTGSLGTAMSVLCQLRSGKKLRPQSHRKHFYPEPRLAVAQFLREKKLATAMIDISDGLSTDLAHLCEESNAGAVVYADALPAPAGKEGLNYALHGGDEYELLFTARSGREIPGAIAGVAVTRIGEILAGKQMRLATSDGKTEILEPAGWEHFG